MKNQTVEYKDFLEWIEDVENGLTTIAEESYEGYDADVAAMGNWAELTLESLVTIKKLLSQQERKNFADWIAEDKPKKES